MDLCLISIFQISVYVILHCVGLHLLICIHSASQNHSKTLFETNVSYVGILINFLLTLLLILILYAIHAIAIITGNIIWSVLLIFAMRIGYVCINKLLESVFNMVYATGYSTKAPIFLVLSWITAFTYCAGVVLTLDQKYRFLQGNIYFILSLDIIFIVVVPACHTFLFNHYRKLCRGGWGSGGTNGGNVGRGSDIAVSNGTSSGSGSGNDSSVRWFASICTFKRPLVSICILIAFFIFSAFPQVSFMVIRGEIWMNDQTTMFATLVFNIVLQFCISSDIILYIVSYCTHFLRNGQWMRLIGMGREDNPTVILSVTETTEEMIQLQVMSSTEQSTSNGFHGNDCHGDTIVSAEEIFSCDTNNSIRSSSVGRSVEDDCEAVGTTTAKTELLRSSLDI